MPTDQPLYDPIASRTLPFALAIIEANSYIDEYGVSMMSAVENIPRHHG
jgi:hypothetical protein